MSPELEREAHKRIQAHLAEKARVGKQLLAAWFAGRPSALQFEENSRYVAFPMVTDENCFCDSPYGPGTCIQCNPFLWRAKVDKELSKGLATKAKVKKYCANNGNRVATTSYKSLDDLIANILDSVGESAKHDKRTTIMPKDFENFQGNGNPA